jgi:hydroxyquinol 1,2-dioxygenase
MRELTPDTITDAVLEQMATTPDPRLKTIAPAAVKHLHTFAREVSLPPARWTCPIEALPRVGADPSEVLKRAEREAVHADAG